MTSLFPPRESLVSDIPAGDGNIKKLFYCKTCFLRESKHLRVNQKFIPRLLYMYVAVRGEHGKTISKEDHTVVKKAIVFPVPSRDVTNQSESLVSDIPVFPAGGGKIGNLFLQCTLFATGEVNAPTFSKHNNVGIDLSPLLFTGGDFYVLNSTLLHLPPIRFHSVAGCWA
jgi:hypothetical protein